jgi:hypothetical protein
MTIKVAVKWKFKVNQKEYGSREEMPENIRHLYDKAVANSSSGDCIGSAAPATKIVFDGQEYASVDRMPADVRQVFETVLMGPGDSLTPGEPESLEKTILTQHGHTNWARFDEGIESATSVKRWLFTGFIILLALAGLYFLLREG